MVFITCDFIALLLQAAGGAIASTSNTISMDNIGKNIMVAGVAWQVFSLALFAALCSEYTWRVRNASKFELNPDFESLRNGHPFKAFLWCLGVATLAIFIRSVFRCAELSGGFHGKLANQQVTFMTLEGAMISIAVICLTVLHPGLIFREAWHAADWSVRKNKSKPVAEKLDQAVSPPEYNDPEMHSVAYQAVRPADPPSR
jgi:hypothetical protein